MLSTIQLRERELTRALGTLGPSDLAVLMKLVTLADAGTGIVHIRSDEFAAELVMDPQFIHRALDRLLEREFLEDLGLEGDAALVELGPLLIRRGVAPSNLPLGQSV